MLYSKKYTRPEIQRMLYLPSRTGYYRMRKKITEIIKNSVPIWNEQ
jgi:hypothetical protein